MVIRQLLLALEMPMGHPLVSQSLLPKPVTFKYNFVENTLEIMLTHKSRLQKKKKKRKKIEYDNLQTIHYSENSQRILCFQVLGR